MSILVFFTALEHSWLGQTIQGSIYIFPITEVFHLLGLAVLGGAILLVDMRLLGLGLKNHAPQQLARDVQPLMKGALIVMALSGITLFVSEAVKCYYHQAFWFKMSALALALTFTFTWRKKVLRSASAPATQKLTAIVSLMLWSSVGIGGRWIGFE